jgi:hypothetical protein
VVVCYAVLGLWPSPCLDERPQADSTPPRRKRANAPKAFAGLTHKPHCAPCEQEAATPTPPPLVRPDPMPPTNRRTRAIDTSMHFCPHDGWPLSQPAQNLLQSATVALAPPAPPARGG